MNCWGCRRKRRNCQCHVTADRTNPRYIYIERFNNLLCLPVLFLEMIYCTTGSFWYFMLNIGLVLEKFEDNKGLIEGRILNDRQYNGQKKRTKELRMIYNRQHRKLQIQLHQPTKSWG